MPFITNSHGIAVRKACMSCLFKEIDDEWGRRHCRIHHMTVRPHHCCPYWLMQPLLDNAGRGGGRVRVFRHDTPATRRCAASRQQAKDAILTTALAAAVATDPTLLSFYGSM